MSRYFYMLCMRCGYDLRGTDSRDNCPECGLPVEETMRRMAAITSRIVAKAHRHARTWPVIRWISLLLTPPLLWFNVSLYFVIVHEIYHKGLDDWSSVYMIRILLPLTGIAMYLGLYVLLHTIRNWRGDTTYRVLLWHAGAAPPAVPEPDQKIVR